MKIRPRRFIRKHILGEEHRAFRRHQPLFEGKIGLEIGGPSLVFESKELLPVYDRAARVDGVNFAANTLWEGRIHEGLTYKTGERQDGRQYICEGSKLTPLADGTYDFLLGSHCLEHSANPLRAVAEWKRVLKPGGAMLLLLPDKRRTFDHRRPTTTFGHLLSDYERDVQEDDLTHLPEILELHDLAMDLPAGNLETFRARSLENFENRGLHHHVFDEALLRKIFSHFDLELRYTAHARPCHVIALGTVRPSPR